MKGMSKIYIPLLAAFFFFSCGQESAPTVETKPAKDTTDIVRVSIPEVYELANIILAMTDYGISDPQEVHKGTSYYDEMRKFFEPAKDHPLLKKVNYSRELWETLLSFRTDAAAFSFDSAGVIKRDFEFYANTGYKPFDDNLALINDFAKKSHFREFYKAHQPFYRKIVDRYSAYYMIPQVKQFLDSIAGKGVKIDTSLKYRIILSPFVGRMNCHRDLDSLTTADFPPVANALLQQNDTGTVNREEQALEIHTVFTEMDHGYVNPISDAYDSLLMKNFDYKKWDFGSGYEEACFNEYMTWAVYDLFVDKYFPEYSRTICAEWHYQNATRGFFASNLFGEELRKQMQTKDLKSCYPGMLSWCSKTQATLRLPEIVLPKPETVAVYDPKKPIAITFSEPMKKDPDTLNVYIGELRKGQSTGKGKLLKLTPSQVTWDGNTLLIREKPDYKEFSVSFTWWGVQHAITNEQGVWLSPNAYATFKRTK
jgi:hypothetical protein